MTAPWDERSPDEHERVTELALRDWLPAACAFSPFWADRVAELGIDPSEIDTPAELSKALPTVREAQIRLVGGAGAPALLMRPTAEQIKSHATWNMLRSIGSESGEGERRAILTEYKPVHVHRGGVDGELAIGSTRADLDRMHRCGARAARVLGLEEADNLVNALPAGPRSDWWGVYHLALASSMLALHPRSGDDPLELVLDSFELVPTTVVAVLVEEAVELAELVAAHGVDASRVHTVVTVGPPPDPGLRKQVQRAWRAAGAGEDELVVRAAYAPTDARALWAEPRAEPTGLVTYPDLEILETVDAISGKPAPEGDLTITTVGWHGSALLRYQTGTFVEGIDTGPCPASGLTAPRIVGEVVERAWQPDVLNADGLERWFDFRSAGHILARAPGVEAWRIELRGPNQKVSNDRVLIEVGGGVDERTVAALYEQIEIGAGVSPHDIHVASSPASVQKRTARLGSPFADRRD